MVDELTVKTVLCPNCGSARVNKSPSGLHLICLDCQRVIVQDRIKKPRGRKTKGRPPRSLPEPRPEPAS